MSDRLRVLFLVQGEGQGHLTQAIALAFTDEEGTTVGAAVAVNVALLDTAASVGDGISAGVSVTLRRSRYPVSAVGPLGGTGLRLVKEI